MNETSLQELTCSAVCILLHFTTLQGCSCDVAKVALIYDVQNVTTANINNKIFIQII